MSRRSGTAELFIDLRQGLRDWVRTDRDSWIYVGKTVGAALLALGVSMGLELDSPRTAMVTVFIVSQPRSGMVLSKGLNRILATLVGSVVGLVLAALFAQHGEMFLLGLSLWVGLCIGASVRYRNYQSYAFLLASYTACIVGLPAGMMPDGAFYVAATRVAEVCAGVLCAVLASAVILPQRAGTLLPGAVRAHFASLTALAADLLAGVVDRERFDRAYTKLMAEVSQIESYRTVAVLEDPRSKVLGRPYCRSGGDLSAVAARLMMLDRSMRKIRGPYNTYGTDIARVALDQRGVLAEILGSHRGTGDGVAVPSLSEALESFRDRLPALIDANRRMLSRAKPEPGRLADFDVDSELLSRLVADLLDYANTYLVFGPMPAGPGRGRDGAPAVVKISPMVATITGLRAAVALALTAAFWLASAWPDGALAVTIVVVVCALYTPAQLPVRGAFEMFGGTLLAIVAGYLCVFWVYPRVDGFMLMCFALSPFLVFGAFLSTRPSWAWLGTNFSIYFAFMAGPDNLMNYDIVAYTNSALSQLLGMLVAAAAFGLIMPVGNRFLAKRLELAIRGQAQIVCSARGHAPLARFGRAVNDLLRQVKANRLGPDSVCCEATVVAFTVLELGHAVLDIRREMSCAAAVPPWLGAELDNLLPRLGGLLAGLSTGSWQVLLADIHSTEKTIAARASSCAPTERIAIERIGNSLRFIGTVLQEIHGPTGPGVRQDLPVDSRDAA